MDKYLKGVKDHNHPIWPIVRLSILMLSMSFVLWLLSSNFDKTEIRSIILIFVTAASTEGAIRAARHALNK